MHELKPLTHLNAIESYKQQEEGNAHDPDKYEGTGHLN